MRPQFGRLFRRKKRLADGTRVELPTWWIEYYRNGKQQRESGGSIRRRDAERLLKQRQGEILNGTCPGPESRQTTVAHLLDDLLRDFEINGKSFAWAKFVDGHLRPYFGWMKAERVTSSSIEEYIQQRRRQGIATSTINRELARLRRAFNLGRQATPPKVTHAPRIPRLSEPPPRKGFFEHDDFLKLRTELPEHLRPVITFGYYSGCRKGEILSLRWEQVDFAHRVTRLEPGTTKNREARTIPLSGELYEMLALQKQIRDQRWPACPWVFSRYGKCIKNFQGAWEEASKRAGLVDGDAKPLRLFHDLRRTGVRNLIRAGVPERVAMTISGHKTRSMLDRYNIVSEQDLHDAGWRLERYMEETRTEHNKDTTRTPMLESVQPLDNVACKLLN